MIRIASLLVFLTLQRSAAAILLHEAGTGYSIALVVLLGEVLKQIGSVAIAISQHVEEERREEQSWLSKQEMSERTGLVDTYKEGFNWFYREAWQQNKTATCLPAALYVMQNNLYLYASSRLLPGIVQGLWQLRLIPIAIFSQLILSRYIARAQWLALSATLLGIIVLQQGQHPADSHGITPLESVKSIDNLMPLCAIVLAATFSSLASVLLERLFIDKKTNLWVANYQLSIFSLPPALLLLVLECARSTSILDPFRTLFQSQWPAIAILIQGLAGLLVALTTKYAGSVAGGLSGVASIALTRMIQLLRGNGTSLSKESSFFGGFVLIVIGVSAYIRSNPPSTDKVKDSRMGLDNESQIPLLPSATTPPVTSPQHRLFPLYNDTIEENDLEKMKT